MLRARQDSNLRGAFTPTGLASRRNRPLCHMPKRVPWELARSRSHRQHPGPDVQAALQHHKAGTTGLLRLTTWSHADREGFEPSTQGIPEYHLSRVAH